MFVKGYFGGIVSGVLNKLLRKNLGIDSELDINRLEFKPTEEGKVQLNIDVEMSKEDFDKLMEVVIK